MYFKTVPINSTHVIIVTLTVSRAADACSRGVMVPMRPNATDSDAVTAPRPQENRHDRAGPSEPGQGRLARGPATRGGRGGQQQRERGRHTAAIGTRPYLRAWWFIFIQISLLAISTFDVCSKLFVWSTSRLRPPLVSSLLYGLPYIFGEISTGIFYIGSGGWF